MTIRTISQLPEETLNIGNDSLIEISKQYDSKYISKKLKVGFLENTFTNTISTRVGEKFNLYDSSRNPINVRELSSAVIDLYYNDIELFGRKTFRKIPRIEVDQNEYKSDQNPSNIPNITKVKDIIDDRACFIADSYKIDSDPGSDFIPPYLNDSEEFLHWHFDNNTNDSTDWMNPEASNQKTDKNGQTCHHTGYLTIYGWLADHGNVLPQDAWVGLYGKINVLNEDTGELKEGQWILLQLQPWVRGTHATQLQYIGFNIPVKSGLQLKIKTGFKVNGNVGGFQDHNSITWSQNCPNSFVGYIVRSQDS